MTLEEERIGLFLDYENLAIGARDNLGIPFNFKPIADALAERGRVVVRRAYADWSFFDEDRRMLARHQVELIEIPQRMGAVRKNAADIKMAVDAIELSFEREYVTTFVIATGDSDFTPLVQKLRELNKRVVGIGIEAATSNLLPPACDEFLFYDRLEGVDLPARKEAGRKAAGRRRVKEAEEEAPPAPRPELHDLVRIVTQTLSGLERSASGPVLASTLKRAILRKEPTFTEADYGFRAFGELLRHLEEQQVVELGEGTAKGDPEVSLPSESPAEEKAFDLLRTVVERIVAKGSPPPLSGLKNQIRKVQPDFSEKQFGYGGFLQFCKAAAARGIVDMDWDDEADDYLLRIPA